MSRYAIQPEPGNKSNHRFNGPDSPSFRSENESSPDFYHPQNQTNGFKKPIENSSRAQAEDRNNLPSERKNSQHNSQYSDAATVVIQISLGALGEREIICNLDDNPETLAYEFCNEYGLAREAVPIIVDMIHKQFNILFKKQQKRSAPKRTDPEIFTFSPNTDEPTEVAANLRHAVELTQKNSKENIFHDQDQLSEPQSQPASNRKKSSVASAKNKLIIKLDIDINPYEKRELCLFKGQDPEDVAQQFCYENNLPETIIGVLTNKLQEALTIYETKRARKKTLQTEEEETQAPFIQRTPKHASTGTFKPLNEVEPVPNEENANSAAAKYEKWQSLIKEKEKTKTEAVSQFSTEERGRKMNDDLYQIASTSIGPSKTKAKSPIESHRSTQSKSPRSHIQSKVSSRDIDEISDRLYYSGKVVEAKLNRIRAEEAQKKEEEISKELIFQPNADRKDRSKSSEPPVRRYMNIEAERQKQKRLEAEKLLALAEECPFKPQLNETTLEIVKDRRSKSPIHHRLYYEGVAHERHMEEWRDMAFSDVYPFKPTLPHDIDDFIQKRPKLNQQDFIRRLIQEKADKELRRLKVVMEENNGRDPKTGRKLFHPYVPHDKFYWLIKEKDDEKSMIYLDVETLQVKKKDSQQRPTINSAKHLGTLKYIFDKLDHDKDNHISTSRMDPSHVEYPLLEALCDFFSWLDEHQATVDFPGFCVAIERLGLEGKIHEAIDQVKEDNPTISNELFLKCYESVRFPRANKDDITFPNSNGSIYEPEKSAKSGKSPSNKTDSNRTLNYSKDSTKLTKHYSEILSRKKSERSF